MLVQCAFCDADDLSAFGTVIHEDHHCAVLLHPDNAVAGHAMVVWKRHIENVAGLASEELVHFASVHRAAERVLLQETGRRRAILLKLGIQVPHLHLHIYPVGAGFTRDDVMRAINGDSKEERPEGFAERCARALTELLP